MDLSGALRVVTEDPTRRHLSITDKKCTTTERSLFVALLAAIQQHPSICAVWLEGCGLGNASAQLVAQYLLHRDSRITFLSLRSNDIADDGVAAICARLHHNRMLVGLHISGNPFGSKAAAAMATMLRHNKILGSLGIGVVDTYQPLLQVIDWRNHTLYDLDPIPWQNATDFQRALLHNKISRTMLRKHCAAAIVAILRSRVFDKGVALMIGRVLWQYRTDGAWMACDPNFRANHRRQFETLKASRGL